MILTPQDRAQEPLASRPDTIGQPRSHRWGPMMNAALVFYPQAAMSAATVVLYHRSPAHPTVVQVGLGKGQRLSHFTLMVQPTRAIMTLYTTRIDLLVAQQR